MDYWIDKVNMEVSYSVKNNWIFGSNVKTSAIHVIDGKFDEIISQTDFEKQNITAKFSANNALILPALIDKHIHLDKLKMGEPWQAIKPADSLVQRFEQEIPDLDNLPSTIKQRANKMIELEKTHGVIEIRSHVDVEPMTDLRYFNAIKKIKDNSDLNIEIVVFPQHGLLRSNSINLVKQALANGADFIGGVDPYSLDNDYEKSLKTTFELANEYQVGVDIHVHDRKEAGKTTILEIIKLTRQYNLQDKVYISHAFGLNDFIDQERIDVFEQLANLSIHIVTSVPLDANTIPPIVELISAGVKVHVGNDNVYDSWSPYGTGSLQEKLNRLGEMFDVTSQDNLTQLLGVATNGIVTLDHKGELAWPQVNDDANFILVNTSSSAEFVARQNPVQASYRAGLKVF